MKVVLDACVLFPPVLRAILLGTAAAGLYTPLWSDRILAEWARATARLGPEAEAQARADAALARTTFPRATVAPQRGIEARLMLPDENDIHVLATAIAGHADAVLTFNAKDFPRHVLAADGIARRDPDGFLWELWSQHPGPLGAEVARVHAEAERRAGQPVSLRALLRRNQLPRLGRALQDG